VISTDFSSDSDSLSDEEDNYSVSQGPKGLKFLSPRLIELKNHGIDSRQFFDLERLERYEISLS